MVMIVMRSIVFRHQILLGQQALYYHGDSGGIRCAVFDNVLCQGGWATGTSCVLSIS